MNAFTIASRLSLRTTMRGGRSAAESTVRGPAAFVDTDKDDILESAYEEYCQRIDAGEKIDASTFGDRFPQCRSSLRRRLVVHQYFEQNPDLVEEWAEEWWPTSGDTFLCYDLIDELGRGATSRVFLAEQRGLGQRKVVVKISQIAGSEAEILGKLDHPNVVPVFSTEDDPQSGLTAICMPYTSRSTLNEFLNRAFTDNSPPKRFVDPIYSLHNAYDEGELEKLSADALRSKRKLSYVNGVLDLAAQLFEALLHTHAQGILHLDLKPSNVLITPCGRPMLLDFNLSADESLGVGLAGGTLPYMSPEQIQATVLEHGLGDTSVDHRSDIYSLGVILFELLAGRHPFSPNLWNSRTDAIPEKLLDRQQRSPLALRDFNPSVDAGVVRLVEACVAFDPNDRPQSAADAANLCRKELSRIRRTRRWAKTHRRLTALAATFLLTLCVATSYGAYWWATLPPRSERELQAGWVQFEKGDYDGALKHFREAAQDKPKLAEAWYALGRTRLAKKDYAAARDDFQKAQKLVPNGRNCAYIGLCQQKLHELDSAIAWYLRAERSGFESSALYNNLGRALSTKAKTLKDYDAADQFFDRAVQKNDDSQTAWRNRARNAFYSMNYARESDEKLLRSSLAVSSIEAALEIGPRTPESLYDASIYVRQHAYLVKEFGDTNPLEEGSPAITKVLDYLDEAIEQGMDLEKQSELQAWSRNTPEITGHPRFVKLLKRRPMKTAPPRQSRLLETMDGTEKSLKTSK